MRLHIKHTTELETASAEAKTHLSKLRKLFNLGLAHGEHIQVKAPFATPAGSHEWMWAEANKQQGDNIEGLVKK